MRLGNCKIIRQKRLFGDTIIRKVSHSFDVGYIIQDGAKIYKRICRYCGFVSWVKPERTSIEELDPLSIF